MVSDTVVAVLLGVVEGVTEFLPVSSTGHLILAGHYLGFVGARADTFEIFIQSGAILAVVALYFQRFWALRDFSEAGQPRGFRGWSGIIKLAVACAPAFVLGALLHKPIKQYLFSPLTVAIGFVVGGILILLVERVYRAPEVETVDALTPRKCFLVGLAQCLGLWPGMSRSGSTMIGAMLTGCSRTVAAEFSFLLAVPVLLAAVALDMYKSFNQLQRADLLLFSVGFLVSFLAAMLAIRVLIRFLGRHSLGAFAYYRIVFGAALIAAWWVGVLPVGM